jgi:hypothetical protein
MRKKLFWMGGCVLAVICSTICAEGPYEVAKLAATQLSADEMAFAARLDDKNRKSFSDGLSTAQRKAVMVAVNNGADADVAVQNMIAAQDVRKGFDGLSEADAEVADAAD